MSKGIARRMEEGFVLIRVTEDDIFRVYDKSVPCKRNSNGDGKEPGAVDLLLNVYKELFGVNFDEYSAGDDEDNKVTAWDYVMSMELATEMINNSMGMYGIPEEDYVSLNLFWMNSAPSYEEELGRYQIMVKEG